MPPSASDAGDGVAVREADARPAPDLARRRRIPGYLTIGDLVPSSSPTHPWTPAHELLAAVLRDAIRTLLKPPRGTPLQRSRRLWEERAWFHGAPATVSFEMVCAYLHLDPDWLRRQVRQAGGGV